MVGASHTVVVDRPIEDVFAFFTTHTNDPLWRTHVKEIREDGPPAVGNRVHQVVSGPGGRGIPADIEVTTYEPLARYAFKVVAGPVRPTGEFTFTPVDAGTQVTLTLAATLSGLKSLLMSRSVQSSMDGEVRGLETAKRLIEGS